MPLVSLQVSVGPKILRPWGISSVSPAATVWDLFVDWRDGSIASSSNFAFPPELRDQPVRCSVGAAISGPFQDCPLNVCVVDVHREFGKYLH